MTTTPARLRKLGLVFWCCVVLLGIPAIGLGVLVYVGISESLYAERGLHAMYLSIELLEEPVRTYQGEWPRSWADLERLPPRERGIFKWPEQSREVQKYIAVDFTANPRELAKQRADEFQAIKPIGPNYGCQEYLEPLLNALRKLPPRRTFP